MANNDNTYSLSDIFRFEDITRKYSISEGVDNLPIHILIELATLEDEFDIDYAYYLMFKRLYQIDNYITKKAKNIGFDINVKENDEIEDEILSKESEYESWVDFYYNHSFYDEPDEPDVYDIIDQAVIGKNWNVLYYIYYKEKSELNSLIAREEEDFNDRKYEEKQKNRKFLIIQ